MPTETDFWRSPHRGIMIHDVLSSLVYSDYAYKDGYPPVVVDHRRTNFELTFVGYYPNTQVLSNCPSIF